MKKLLCVVPALLLCAMIGAPNAHADSYTPTFSCVAMPSSDFGCHWIADGYTSPNVSFPSASVEVTVSSFPVFDVALPAIDTPTDAYTYEFSFEPVHIGDSVGTLTIDDVTTGIVSSAEDFLPGGGENDLIGNGALTFSPISASTPEPAPVILMLLGAGLIFFIRKRFVSRVPIHSVSF